MDVPANFLESGLCFRVNYAKARMDVECTWCSNDDYIVSSSEYDDDFATDFTNGWISKFVQHCVTHHAAQLKKWSITT